MAELILKGEEQRCLGGGQRVAASPQQNKLAMWFKHLVRLLFPMKRGM